MRDSAEYIHRKNFGIILAALLVVSSLVCAQDGPDKEQWISLFNGHDLDGWIIKIRKHPLGDNYASTFRVVDGMLTVSYEQYGGFSEQFGHIFYKQPYSHYRLRVEYRFIGDSGPDVPGWAHRNSGVMLHSQPPQTMQLDQDFPISVEFQFLGGLNDGNDRPTGSMCSPGTHVVYQGELNTNHCLTSSSATYHGDQWVMAEALVLGNTRITHFIENRKVIEYNNPSFGGGVVSGFLPEMKPDGEPLGEGYIALQSEGHPVQFRRIELLNLKGCMDSSASNFKSYYMEPDPEACSH